MSVEILMPELGESVHEGTVNAWLKKVGDEVKEDEPIVEIMTDKVNTELPAPASGILVEILIPEGEDVEVFKAMGIIEPDKAKAREMLESGNGQPAEREESEQEGGEGEQARADDQADEKGDPQEENKEAPAAGDGDRRWYSPVVRAMAREHGLSDSDLRTIAGSGKGGRVTKKDVEQFLAGGGKPKLAEKTEARLTRERDEPVRSDATPQAPQAGVERLKGMRKMIAEHMERSAAIPTVSTLIDVDVTSLVAFRSRNKESFQEQHGVKLTYTPFFIKSIAECLAEFPALNSAMLEDFQVQRHDEVNMGIAVALGKDGEGGLIVPVIRSCEKKSLVDIAHALVDIADKARNNDLDTDDVKGGTFTLTNPGTYGALLGTPMISAPQAGIVGTYGIKEQPVAIDGMIAIRSIMNVVLTYDHRLVDGLQAGRFLQSLKQKLESFDFFK